MCVFVYTVQQLGSNEELINRVFPLVPWAGGWNSQAELGPNTDTLHAHTHDGRTHRACSARQRGHPRGVAAGLDHSLGQEGKGGGGRAALQLSETNFSHGIWILHRHPKSIGCAYWLGFGRAEGKIRLDLFLTYGREQRGGALYKHTCILSTVFTGKFVIAWSMDQSVNLFRAHEPAVAPVMKTDNVVFCCQSTSPEIVL